MACWDIGGGKNNSQMLIGISAQASRAVINDDYFCFQQNPLIELEFHMNSPELWRE